MRRKGDAVAGEGESATGQAVAARRQKRARELWDLTAAVAGRLNRVQGELVAIAAEVLAEGHWGDGGFRSAEHYLVVRAGLSPTHAKDIVAVARRREELGEASAALATGTMSLDQVAVVARGVPAGYVRSVTQLARHATVPQLRRAVARHAFAVRPELEPPESVEPPDALSTAGGTAAAGDIDATAPLALLRADAMSASERRACARPQLAMSYDADGRFQLRYSAPAPIGALVEQAVREARDTLFHAHAESSQPDEPVPSYAEAVAELAHRSLAGVASTSRSAHYRVYLHLSTDVAWVNGGPAIPRRLLDPFVTDGVVQPVWETQGRPVSVGRSLRIVPDRSRRLVVDRDRGCRFPGCTATRFVEIHHLKAWSAGGGTDWDNLVSLCPFHHDAIGRGDYALTGDPTHPRGLVATNRYGLRIRPPSPPDLVLRRGPSESDGRPYPAPSGEPIRWADLELPPDHALPSDRGLPWSRAG